MTQEPLFKDILADWLSAIGADVHAAGGEKIVGGVLWPNLKPATAQGRLSNALNAKQRHELSAAELWQIKQMAHAAVGRSQIHELESSALNFEGRWLTTEDLAARRKKRIASLMAALQAELAQENA